MPKPSSRLARLDMFRSELHACYPRRADALFGLGDALLGAQAVPSLPHLSLEPVHRRGWGGAYAALARGRIDTDRLRDLLASSLPPADPLVFAVDVTTWPRCDAESSPCRGSYYHPSRHSAGQPIIAGWAFQWIAQVSFDRTPGPPQWMPAACTRWRTPTAPPPRRSGRCWDGYLSAGRCRCSCSTAATTPPRCPWTSPTLAWRCWCGGALTAVSTPTRRQRRAHPRAVGRAATGPGSPSLTRPPGRPRPPPLSPPTTRTAP